MPQGDRTGPVGAGPRTGRALGYCGGYEAPGFAHSRPGGFGRGLGRGRGLAMRHGFFAGAPFGRGFATYAPPTREETLSGLKANAEWLKGQLETVNKRIEELDT